MEICTLWWLPTVSCEAWKTQVTGHHHIHQRRRVFDTILPPVSDENRSAQPHLNTLSLLWKLTSGTHVPCWSEYIFLVTGDRERPAASWREP